ncbi:MAG: glycosyltransferase family 4 protein [Verrucomicrobia bacterium]|nr:glycosyltransferase family 4 protein [Verrucomicrobiota bacterium]MBS0637316.1 glycosyltransferase family 4 protein [Verrucomicrobiota bacterium]
MHHVLNLDTVGGVEELFIHFLSLAKQLSDEEQHILVTSNKPHPFFEKYLASADSITVEKYFGPCKLPGFLRTLQRKRALKNATTTVLWNRMEEYPWPGKVIYYEHGASWISKKSNNFFKIPDAILANSHAAKRLLQLKWGVQTAITVIENPLKPTITAGTPKKAPQALRLGYIGRLIPLKGTAIILHALKMLPGATLTVAGDGPEKESLMKEAARLGVPVTFFGAIKDVSGFYDSIDLLIVPSIREPLGLVAQEAALRGCPVIAAKVDGLPEVVQDAKTGFCIEPTLDLAHYPALGGTLHNMPDLVYNPTSDSLAAPKLIDPTSLAKTILSITPELYETMSANAIAFASKRPNFMTYTKQLLDLIKS